MNNLCADIGYKSVNHYGEQLCGDHVDIVEQNDSSVIVVLADGLGSGVKASILSTLTSTIISTMMAEGLSLEDCVGTIAATLPVCSVRGVAYSTFTIIHIINNERAEIIQYDNPHVILIRDFANYDYPKTTIGGKQIFNSVVTLKENDIFVAMSDGCPHAGIGVAYNFGWQREDIISFMESIAPAGYTAKTLSTILVDECDKLYDHKPGDDATACVVRIRKREPMNILFGPCTAKKMEAQLDTVRPYIDSVMTFEELQALFDSRDLDITTLEEGVLDNASYYGRIFARCGGLADAVAEGLKEQNIDFELKACSCDGIEACRMALLKMSKNVLDANFVEGMACVGGCIGGAGCLTHGEKNKAEVDKYGREALEKTIADAVSVLH